MGAAREPVGILAVLVTAVLWGTTGTAATFAPDVGPLAIGAAALGIGGLLQALIALPPLRRDRALAAARVREARAARGATSAGDARAAVSGPAESGPAETALAVTESGEGARA